MKSNLSESLESNRDSVIIKIHEGLNAEDILIDDVPLHESQESMGESLHNLFNKNLFMVTRMFDSRVQAFIKHILLGSGTSGLKVQNFCYRIEFQARGMPHIHGVLWLERESIKEYLIKGDEYKFELMLAKGPVDRVMLERITTNALPELEFMKIRKVHI